MKFVVLIGAPGAGKGTQARLLQQSLGLPQVASGDLFRHNLSNKTELGVLAKQYMDKGELVPNEVTVAMVGDRLRREDCAGGAILDGFPRNLEQATALDALLADLSGQVDVVAAIEVDEDDLVDRLLKRAQIEGRADDNEETIRTRMRIYNEQTRPVLDYYDSRQLLVYVNGDQPIEMVQRDLVQVVADADGRTVAA